MEKNDIIENTGHDAKGAKGFDYQFLYFMSFLKMKKIGVENIILKKRILIKKFDDIIYCIKLSYRDFRAGFNKVELWYENLNLKIS